MKKTVSLQDIATAAKVSKMTVSLALRDHPRISADTRKRVKSLATKLGYKPDPEVARFMSVIRKHKSSDKGLPIACISTGKAPGLWRESPTERAYWDGACERALSYGYYMVDFWLEKPQMTEHRLSDILWNRGIKGILIPPVLRVLSGSTREVRLDLDWDRFCAVTIGDPLTWPELNRVVHDHYTSILSAMKHLMQRGYRRIGLCLREHMDLTVNQRWQAGYRVFRASHPVPRIEPLIRPELEPDEVRQWLADNQIDSILSAGHRMPDHLRGMGIEIGSKIGYADLDLYPDAPYHAGISGIMQNSTMLGMAAVDMLVAGLQRGQTGVPKVPFVTQVRGSWLDRGSTPQIGG